MDELHKYFRVMQRRLDHPLRDLEDIRTYKVSMRNNAIYHAIILDMRTTFKIAVSLRGATGSFDFNAIRITSFNCISTILQHKYDISTEVPRDNNYYAPPP